jgi:hypothetical protein
MIRRGGRIVLKVERIQSPSHYPVPHAPARAVFRAVGITTEPHRRALRAYEHTGPREEYDMRRPRATLFVYRAVRQNTTVNGRPCR